MFNSHEERRDPELPPFPHFTLGYSSFAEASPKIHLQEWGCMGHPLTRLTSMAKLSPGSQPRAEGRERGVFLPYVSYETIGQW